MDSQDLANLVRETKSYRKAQVLKRLVSPLVNPWDTSWLFARNCARLEEEVLLSTDQIENPVVG